MYNSVPLRYLVVALLAAVVACAPTPPPTISLDQATRQVISNLRIFKTATASRESPSPTIVFIHGASDMSWHPEYERWMKRIVSEGFSAVFVDLYTGRGSNGQAARSGGLLPKETAGDLMIVLDWALQQEWVDRSKVFAMGNSFGGATIMDAMVLDAPGKRPLGLASKPSNGMNGVSKAVLLTPLCKEDVMGFNIVAAVHDDFYSDIPTLAILAGADTVSDPTLCQQIFSRNSASGKSVEVVVVDGAGHTFMASEDDYGTRFPDYDKGAAETAWTKAFEFFRK